MSVLDALYTATRKYPGSIEAMAGRMGKNPDILRKKLQPDVDTNHITLEETLEAIELLDGTVPHAADLAIKAIAYRLGRVVVRHDGVDSDPTSLEVQALAMSGAIGLLAADIAVTMAQKTTQQITKKEADTLNADIARCLDALFIIKDTIEHRTVTSSKKASPAPLMAGGTDRCSTCSFNEQASPVKGVLPDRHPLRVLTTPKNRK
jgi:hypothetical protein